MQKDQASRRHSPDIAGFPLPGHNVASLNNFDAFCSSLLCWIAENSWLDHVTECSLGTGTSII